MPGTAAQSRRYRERHHVAIVPRAPTTSVIVPADVVRVLDRDPCKLCGVRGDLGCSHRRSW